MVRVVSLTLVCLVTQLALAAPKVGNCSTSSDCEPSACCLLGYTRHSYPYCEPRGDVNSWCRLMGQPQELILSYPNGLEVEVEAVYIGMCPCRAGLVCSETPSTCQQPSYPSHSYKENFMDLN